MPGTAGGTVRSSALTVSSATRLVFAAGPLAPAVHSQSDDDLTFNTLHDRVNFLGKVPHATCSGRYLAVANARTVQNRELLEHACLHR